MWPPVRSCQTRPSGRLRPSSQSRRYPVTTGGSTRGSINTPCTSARSGWFQRASSQPKKMPGSRLAATLSVATRSERSTTSSSAALAMDRPDGEPLGQQEAGLRQHAAGLCAAEELDEAVRQPRVDRSPDGGGEVLDRRVRLWVEREEKLHVGDARIRRVDEASLELPLLDRMEHRAYVLLADQDWPVRVDQPEPRQGLPRVLPGRHTGVGDRDAIARCEALLEEGGGIVHALRRETARVRGDAHQLVAGEDHGRTVERVLLAEEVDPLRARGHEHVRGCAVHDLAGELARGAEARGDLRVREALREVVHELRHAGRCEDAQRRGRTLRGHTGAAPDGEQAETERHSRRRPSRHPPTPPSAPSLRWP